MKKLLQSLFILLFIAGNAIAQDRTVTGTVTDKADGKPLPGITITIKGAKGATQTGANGKYSIFVPSGASGLDFSSLGYAAQSITSTSSVIDVVMVEDANALSEIVVTGYGTTTKKEITGSVSQISGKVIESLPVQTFDKALQGRAAGVQVTTNSGQPGSGISVRIRGVNTINGSLEPLYIVDGVQIVAGGLSTTTTQNVLGAINPADIESIQILKDAATASIYGSQAANGVVIVTTKRGKSGKTQVRAQVQHGVNQQINPYETTTSEEWYMLRREAVVNRAARLGNPLNDRVVNNVTIPGALTNLNTAAFGQATVPELTTTDWYNEIFRNANFGQYDLSFSGGAEKTRFFISGNYQKTEGVALKSDYNRGGLRANIDNQISDKLSFSTNIALAYTKSAGHGTNQGFFTNTPFTGALYIPPYNTVYMPDGTYRNAPNLRGAQNVNIVQSVLEEQRNTKSFQTISNFTATYKIIPDLNLKAYAGIDFADAKNFTYRPSTIPIYPLGSGAENFIRNFNYNTSITADYAKSISDHNFSVLGGFEYRSNEQTQLGATAQGFPSPLFTLLSQAATPLTTTSTFGGYKIASLIGSAKYDYKGKYLISGNLRYDGSSRFGAEYRFGLFGGVSAGWRMTEEEWMKPLTFIDDLKIRLNYGVVGVQPTTDFNALSLYSSPGATGAYNGGASIRPNNIPNPELTWEETQQIGGGIDFAFFGSRLSGSVDYYKKKTTKLLLDRTLPSNSGFGSIRENGGRLDGQGIDVELTTVNLDMDNGFRWSTSFNVAWTKNELKALNNGATRIGNTYIVGKPTNILYSFRYAGVNPADGRPMFYDVNNNITYLPLANTDDTILGYGNPDFYGGLTNTLDFKGFTLDFMFQYQYGNSSYLQTAQILEASGMAGENQLTSQLGRWTTPGQITSIPRAYDGYTEPGGFDPTNVSSRYVQKASYIRLKQVTLNYKLPTTITSKIGVPGISVFVQGLNLGTITNYRGEDPENVGNNLNAYPNPRTFAGGITVNL
jgi:TonB-linked SusC/RagA family outer membrane protein